MMSLSSYEQKDKISAVIATLNEEEALPQVIEKCKKYCSDIIVVDGHSTDGSVALAEKAGARVFFDNKKGKGSAIKTSIPHIKRPVVVFLDADGSHDPDDIPKLVKPIFEKKADHVTGSRLLGGSSELHGGFDEFLRLMGSSFITACIGWKFKVRISDSQNGFRSMRTEVLKKLGLKENITTIEQEMVIKTLKKGYRLKEVPTHEYRRMFGTSHIKISKVWFRYIYSLIKYLFF